MFLLHVKKPTNIESHEENKNRLPIADESQLIKYVAKYFKHFIESFNIF